MFTDYSTYAPDLPVAVAVSPTFGAADAFHLDGHFLTSAGTVVNPTIEIKDSFGAELLTVTLDPSNSRIQIEAIDLGVRMFYTCAPKLSSQIMV